MSYDPEDRALVCPYCFKTFREPVKLPCGHNLCSECVGRIRRGAETSRETKMKLNEEGECEDVCDVKTLCPVCEKEFNSGDEKPNDELRELICGEKVYYCDECEGDEKRVATRFCVICKEEGKEFGSFCDEHWDFVHRPRSFRGHVGYEKPPVCLGFDGYLNPVLEVKGNGEEKKYPICFKHERPAMRMMKENGDLLCQECLNELDNWKPEDTERMEDVVEDSRKRLKEKCEKVGVVSEFEGYLNEIEGMIGECEKSKRKYLKEIDDYIDGYVKMLEDVRKHRKDCVEGECDKYSRYLNRIKGECEDIIRWMRECKEIEDFVDRWDDYHECIFEKRVDEVMNRMKEIELRIGKCGDIRRLEISFEMGDIPSEESIAMMKKKYALAKKPVVEPEPKPVPVPAPEPSIAGYKEVKEGLMRDKEGNHEEAMELYEKAGKLGNKAAFLNMGNCYMFGKGVKEDWKKGIEMYGKCGRIGDGELGWIRELSNDKFVCGTVLNLLCLFLFIEQFSVL